MPDGLMPYCIACGPAVQGERRRRKNERSKAWYAANKEKARESARNSLDKNRRARLAYMREWRKKNRDRISEYQRAYAQKKRLERTGN